MQSSIDMDVFTKSYNFDFHVNIKVASHLCLALLGRPFKEISPT